MDPLSLDWGGATAEFANEEKNAATHILAHNLSTPERADRSVRFALGRVQWFAVKMPPGGTQEVWFDDREQQVPADVRKSVKDRVTPAVAGLLFFSEGEA
ncbi:MAG TPA: hypothetical protein VE981_04810 [Planctomycetota bacterium]|nr:hypothetical protein [Planctomycetota bacterium]